MTIIDATKHLDGQHLKDFISNLNDASDKIILTDADMTFQSIFRGDSFVKDLLTSDIPEIDSLKGTDELFIINEETVLKTSVNDLRWYTKAKSKRRINALLDEVYDRKTEKDRSQKRQTKAMLLAEKAETMSKERIFAVMLEDDVDSIIAYKGTGQQCIDWLNRQVVIHYDKVETMKLHLNLTESSSISEFKTIKELIEEGSLIL